MLEPSLAYKKEAPRFFETVLEGSIEGRRLY